MKLLNEPLLHFLVAGDLLFAGYAGRHRAAQRPDDPSRIEITANDIRRLEIACRPKPAQESGKLAAHAATRLM